MDRLPHPTYLGRSVQSLNLAPLFLPHELWKHHKRINLKSVAHCILLKSLFPLSFVCFRPISSLTLSHSLTQSCICTVVQVAKESCPIVFPSIHFSTAVPPSHTNVNAFHSFLSSQHLLTFSCPPFCGWAWINSASRLESDCLEGDCIQIRTSKHFIRRCHEADPKGFSPLTPRSHPP